MTDCGCDKAKAELEEYLRHELTADEAQAICDHLEHCTDCADEAHVGQVLTQAVRRACRETAPEDLREQVLARLRAFQATR